MRPLCAAMMVLCVTACGSRRIAAYLEALEDCSVGSSETGEASQTGTTHDASSTGDPGSSGGSAESTVDVPSSTETSTGTMDSSGMTDSTGTTGTTGTSMAECGNGVLEAFGADLEECDDGNLEPDDGCSETCALDRRVFVTSIKYQAGELESLYIADALCANHADDAGFPDPLLYRAWLSDSATDARDRFKRGRGRLVLVNGLVLARSWSTLLAGELDNPLEVTETSETLKGRVWTGTRPDGAAVPGAEHCDDWSTSSFLKAGHYGYSDRITSEWTLSASENNPNGCNSEYSIYCFQSL